jgi:hypothetical protein
MRLYSTNLLNLYLSIHIYKIEVVGIYELHRDLFRLCYLYYSRSSGIHGTPQIPRSISNNVQVRVYTSLGTAKAHGDGQIIRFIILTLYREGN